MCDLLVFRQLEILKQRQSANSGMWNMPILYVYILTQVSGEVEDL